MHRGARPSPTNRRTNSRNSVTQASSRQSIGTAFLWLFMSRNLFDGGGDPFRIGLAAVEDGDEADHDDPILSGLIQSFNSPAVYR